MGLLVAILLRITALLPVLAAPLLIAKLLTTGNPGTRMFMEREFDQLETSVVWVAHRALALTRYVPVVVHALD
jgi:hypothetical protein